MSNPTSLDISDHAGLSTRQFDHLRNHCSKRVTGRMVPARYERSAGLSTDLIGEKAHHAPKKVDPTRHCTQIQHLMWQQFAHPSVVKSTQTDAQGQRINGPVVAGKSSVHMSIGSAKNQLRRYGHGDDYVRGFNTKWQPDPTSTAGRMGLYLNRNPGYATLEVDPGKMDMLSTYHREKHFPGGVRHEHQSHIENDISMTSRRDAPRSDNKSENVGNRAAPWDDGLEGPHNTELSPAMTDNLNRRMAPRGDAQTYEGVSGRSKRLLGNLQYQASFLSPNPSTQKVVRGKRRVDAPWSRGDPLNIMVQPGGSQSIPASQVTSAEQQSGAGSISANGDV